MERALNLHPFYDKGDILKNDQAFFPFTFQKHQKKQKERMKAGFCLKKVHQFIIDMPESLEFESHQAPT